MAEKLKADTESGAASEPRDKAAATGPVADPVVGTASRARDEAAAVDAVAGMAAGGVGVVVDAAAGAETATATGTASEVRDEAAAAGPVADAVAGAAAGMTAGAAAGVADTAAVTARDAASKAQDEAAATGPVGTGASTVVSQASEAKDGATEVGAAAGAVAGVGTVAGAASEVRDQTTVGAVQGASGAAAGMAGAASKRRDKALAEGPAVGAAAKVPDEAAAADAASEPRDKGVATGPAAGAASKARDEAAVADAASKGSDKAPAAGLAADTAAGTAERAAERTAEAAAAGTAAGAGADTGGSGASADTGVVESGRGAGAEGAGQKDGQGAGRGFDPFDYPRRWEADVVLSDGGTVHLRPITPDDASRIVALHGRMSERTRYFRYFGPYPRIPERDLRRFSVVDHHGRVAFGAFLGDDLIAVGRYEQLGDGQPAEVAFVVEDAHQGRGLGSILLEHLASAARERGLTRFVAEVLAENGQMVRVFREAGYRVSRAMEDGVVHLEFDIDPTAESVAVAREREQAAEARSVHNLLHPASVAVIGASTDSSKIGYAALTNLLSSDFAGPVYPVNSEHRSVRGVRAYPSVLDIPDQVDLAVVAVPAPRVVDVLDACLVKGVKALVVLSSGFADTGEDGLNAERRLVAEARAHGMRVVGPNALGVVNTEPGVRLNATLAPRLPGPGVTGFFCQSGALGIGILASAAARGLGLSTFVSAGNRADVSGNDLLQYWETDPATKVVLLYLESFGNPRKFARLARRLARHKPIVAVKSGRHAIRPGLAATSVRVDDSSVRTLFEQAGVIRVESLAELFDTALLLANQPLPAGSRVAVVGNSTAIGLLAADTVLAEGLVLAGDPVDTGAEASPERFVAAVREALLREDVDALVVVFVPPLAVPGSAYARALRETVDEHGGDKPDKPIVSTFLAVEGVPDELAVRQGYGSIPSYPSPERAVQALGRVARYTAWRAAPQGEFAPPEGIDVAGARALVRDLICNADSELSDRDSVRLLACYGIGTVPFRLVTDAETAVAAASELGYPVVLKSTSGKLRHRSDLVGVRLDLSGADSVVAAYHDLCGVSGASEMIVQRMAPRGVSCVLGIQDDPSFGALVYFGLSGIVGDLLGDRAYRAVPLTDTDAASLVRAPRAAPLLTGYRGAEPVDLAALEDLVLRVSTMADDLPEIRAFALEPVLASPGGVSVLSAHVVLGPAPSRPDVGPRRLRSIGLAGDDPAP